MEDPVIFSPTTNQHYFVIFLHGRKSNPMIPAEIFATHFEGKNQSTKLKLTSDVSDRTWEVKLDGRRFAGGWEDFSIVHALQDDDVLIFKDNGDMTFHVTASGRSFCKVQCISSDEDDTWDEYSNSKKKSRTENSYLVAHVTSSNLSRDALCLIRGFARSNGLNERRCEIGLMNQHGKLWTLGLRYNTTNDQACIRGGWRDFCFVNGLEAGSFYKFKLVRNGAKPLLQLCSDTIPEGYCYKADVKDKPSSDCLASASMKQNKFLTITFKPYMLESGQLRLPRSFAVENGIKEAEEITLVDKNGVKWPSSVNEQGGFYMAKGWRSFCAANKLKTGVTFTLEFVRGEGKTPMLKFCSKVKIEEEEEEEAQEETETRFQKRARVSEEEGPSRRTRASNKSSADPRNVQCKKPLQSCSISDQMTNVKQGIVETLTGIKLFRSELEIKERNLEGLLLEIDALGEKVLEVNKILK